MSCNPEYLIIWHLPDPMSARLKELKYIYMVCVCVFVCTCASVCCERQNERTAHIRDLQYGTRISNTAIIYNIQYTAFTVTKRLKTVTRPSMRKSRTALHIALVVKSIMVYKQRASYTYGPSNITIYVTLKHTVALCVNMYVFCMQQFLSTCTQIVNRAF